MSGHVFILQADLTRLYCDAWLMPADYHRHVMNHWTVGIPGLPEKWKPDPSREWRDGSSRVLKVETWPKNEPRPWLVNTGGSGRTEVEWYLKGVGEFFRTVAPLMAITENRITNQRSKPLLGIPLVGTGAGGAWKNPGGILKVILPALYDFARDYDVDIALVLKETENYAAAVSERKNLENEKQIRVWPEEFTPLLETVDKLASRAKMGDLVLFIGAGVSASAGLPTWDQLLEILATKAGMFESCETDERELRKAFGKICNLDQARLISNSFGKHCFDEYRKNHIGEEVSRVIGERRHYSIAHAALAALPVNEIVTTNYDELFEAASQHVRGKRPSVLPYDPASPGDRWVLKLHGCISQSEDIVLTRSDYLRYDDRRAALKGIVQALLITRHMLFIGFSLTDDNFHKIVEDVRKAVRGDVRNEVTSSPFGTALSPSMNPFVRQLWSGDVDWVTFEPSEAQSAYRLQEIFLDRLASESIGATSHLMDYRYDALLSSGERALRGALERLASDATDEMKRLPAWQKVRHLVTLFGGKI